MEDAEDAGLFRRAYLTELVTADAEARTAPLPPPAAKPAGFAGPRTDPFGHRILASGAATPAEAATLLGPEDGTHALKEWRVEPGEPYRWDEWQDRDGKFPPKFRVYPPGGCCYLTAAKFKYLFPNATAGER
jgi:hypothetical protein